MRINPRARARIEFVTVLLLVGASYVVASNYDLMEAIIIVTRAHEEWELDELLTSAVVLVGLLGLFSARRYTDVHLLAQELFRRNEELERALTEIKQLRGIIPICAGCKRIRDDQGFWQQVEVYIQDHSQAEFTHGLCPECRARYESPAATGAAVPPAAAVEVQGPSATP